MLEGLFIGFAVITAVALFIARDGGKLRQQVKNAEDDVDALHKSIDEAQEADEIRRKAAADTLTGRMSRKYYRD